MSKKVDVSVTISVICILEYESFSDYSKYFIIRAGFPATTQLSSTSFTTTHPAPITTLFPIFYVAYDNNVCTY